MKKLGKPQNKIFSLNHIKDTSLTHKDVQVKSMEDLTKYYSRAAAMVGFMD